MDENTQRDETTTSTETPTDPMNVTYRALLDHVTSCKRCTANWRECPKRRTLSATLREARG